MLMTASIIGAIVLFIVNWGLSMFILKKFEGKLLGKNWIIGLIGIIAFISISWLLALFVNYYILLAIMVLTLPWWLNYMFYLGKQNRTKERMMLHGN